MQKLSVQDIVDLVGEYRVVGTPGTLKISKFTPIETADEDSLVWIRGTREDRQDVVRATQARVIICDARLQIESGIDKCFIVVENPKLAYLRVVRHMVEQKPPWGIHPSAVIHQDARIHKNTWIGPFCYVGDSEIGEGCILHGHCYVYDNVTLGRNVTLHAHCVVGSDGFGFVWNEQKEIEKFPHVGTVVIEDDVEIFPFANVDRGTLGETRIGAGSRIDHFCHISHNCMVGKETLVTAGTVLCGGSKVGSHSWLGIQTVVKEKVDVGDDVLTGIGSTVTKPVPDGETWVGSPARPLAEFKKIQKQLHKLAEDNDET